VETGDCPPLTLEAPPEPMLQILYSAPPSPGAGPQLARGIDGAAGLVAPLIVQA